MARMTGGRFIAETLHGYGVTHVFFMPYIVPRALFEMEGLGVRRVMAHGEKAAAYMADGYARAGRRAGVCMAQSVGAANLAAGLQDAALACSPVIALTGRREQIAQTRHAYQEIDHRGLFAPVCKYDVLVNEPEQLPYFLRQAFREATSGTPGPVHLDLEGASGHAIADGEADLEVTVEEAFTRVPPFRPEPELSRVHEALRMLAQAERPVIVAGGGVTTSGAGPELVELAEKLSIPVATTLNAKATFPYDHPLALGVCGQYSRACANRAVCEADLVFYIGSHTGGQATYEWRVPPQGTRVMQLDINPSEVGRSYPLALGLQGDAKASLRKMIAHAASCEHEGWIARVQGLVREWREETAPLAHSDAVPIRPERLCRELTAHLPADAILVSDTGHSGIWTGTMVDLKHPGQSYLRCSGSLGWGLPAAMGAKCACPERPVICFCGDGGMWYHLTELETAMRYGIQTVTVVNNNHSLNQEKRGNERTYGGRTPGSDELWVLSDVDFARMAETMGCFGITVHRPGELGGALEQALASGKPAVVDVKTDIEGIAPAPWAPG
jgi:acetolactate synthase-1/2/3 large subunit